MRCDTSYLFFARFAQCNSLVPRKKMWYILSKADFSLVVKEIHNMSSGITLS